VSINRPLDESQHFPFILISNIFNILVLSLLEINSFLFKKGRNIAFNEAHILNSKQIEFYSHTVVTSQCVNKILKVTTPSCFICQQVNAHLY